MTDIYASMTYGNIGLENGLPPNRRQAIDLNQCWYIVRHARTSLL